MTSSVFKRALVVAAALGGLLLVPAVPASAGVGSSASLTVPSAVSVGQTNLAGSFTVVNTNTPPNNLESNTITGLALTMSCGALGSAANPCPSPDPGVFSVNATATGAAGTACAGVTFSVSAPNASGTVTFTPSTPVVLAPPGGAPGSDRCTVNFTFNVLKVPTIDANPGAPGVQTRASLRAQQTSPGNLTPVAFASVEITVNRASPALATQASPTTASVGATLTDTATVTGVAGLAAPTGTVTFNLYGPNDATCTGVPVFTSSGVPLSPSGPTTATATSAGFAPTQPGTYRWVAAYSGDANYFSNTAGCNAPNENVVVSAAPRRPADFDGDNDTDLSVFRPSNNVWYIGGNSPQSVVFGTTGDNPVPADYDGDRKSDIAVFRPSNGVWYILRSAGGTSAIRFGQEGDIPVPADYDGDGKADQAVFRPSTGVWYQNRSLGAIVTIPFGTNGDIPVPADYDGDGKADVAVFRPTTGTWYIQFSGTGSASPVFGANGDIPVPGDYDGDAKADVAVFRPSTGVWYILRSSGGAISPFFGQSGDIPVPGDYDKDAKTDLAVFRPSTGVWYVSQSSGGGTATVFGQNGDIPLPLPYAIRRFFP